MWETSLKPWFDAITAITALIAALYWFRSAKLPVLTPGTYFDGMRKDDPWLVTTRKASKLNKLAAMWTSISAASIFVTWLIGLLVEALAKQNG